ncbi:MAG: hypothetical protein ABJY83_19215 [Roseibium sp.]
MEDDIQDTDKQAALQSVCSSDLFSPLDRLCAFLTYIVTEELAGRGELIRGKTIAQDVYDRDPTDEGDADNVVRVDARRLRRNLAHYYDTVGATDTVRIFVDTGGYRPRFERVESPKTNRASSSKRAFGWAALAFTAGTAIGIVLALGPLQRETTVLPQVENSEQDVLRRQAVREQSASSLQAMNLAEQARRMIFPIFDRPRQELVNEVFNRVIELGPDYFGGYAGAAQTYATLSILTPNGSEKNALLEQAQGLAERASSLAPADPWTQSVQAWVNFAGREFDEAKRVSSRAVQLAPADGNILDIHGSIALFSGDFAEAANSAAKAMNLGRSNQRFANRNIYGASNFHLGNYRESLEAFSQAADFGDPISAPSFAYQVAALYELGRTIEAARKHAEMKKSWPGANVEKILTSVFQDPRHVEEVMSGVKAVEAQKN